MPRDDSLIRAQRGAGRIGRGLVNLFTPKKKAKTTRRPRRRRPPGPKKDPQEEYRKLLRSRRR